MNARLYDYGSGVFTSTDPLFADMQRAGGLNAYGYVYGNPFSFIDPSGKRGIGEPITYEESLSNVNIGFGASQSFVDTEGIAGNLSINISTAYWDAISSNEYQSEGGLEYEDTSLAVGLSAAGIVSIDASMNLDAVGAYGNITFDEKPKGFAFGFSRFGYELILFRGHVDDLEYLDKTSVILPGIGFTIYRDQYGKIRGGDLGTAFGLGYFSSSSYEGTAATPPTFFNPHYYIEGVEREREI